MPGIKHINAKENPVIIRYLANRLIDPNIRTALFDDRVGAENIEWMLSLGGSEVYAIFEGGKPEPIGAVFFLGAVAFRDARLYAVIFDEEKRKKGKLSEVIPKIAVDAIKRFLPHSISTSIINDNKASEILLKKMGFEHVGTKKEAIVAGGKYRDLHEYYILVKNFRFDVTSKDENKPGDEPEKGENPRKEK